MTIKYLDEYTACDTDKLTIFNIKHPDWDPWHTFTNKEDFDLYIAKHFNSQNYSIQTILNILFKQEKYSSY